MKISAIKCNKCGDIIFSRAQHDMRWCSCGQCFIDGGFTEYAPRVGTKGAGCTELELDLPRTREELYLDWSRSIDFYGIIKDVKSEKKSAKKCISKKKKRKRKASKAKKRVLEEEPFVSGMWKEGSMGGRS